MANVSDPNSGGSSNANKSGSSVHNHSQHNYSNVQHPTTLPKNPSNGGSLTSSRTQSSNASPANAMLGPESPFGGTLQIPPNIPPPPVPEDNFGRRATPLEERIRKREQLVAEEAKKSKLAELQDLIHLEQPINEDLVLRALQSRFFSKKFFVSLVWHPACFNFLEFLR